MAFLRRPYLGVDVELTEEREQHIRNHHPDLLPEHRGRMIETVGDPDQVRRSVRAGRCPSFLQVV
jgi:folate-dependent phosphoribosylglycinamide formyltransferase PurN